jgi:predicted cupin superfamily sugar epimerase
MKNPAKKRRQARRNVINKGFVRLLRVIRLAMTVMRRINQEATQQADDLIARLGLKAHPEGGHFRETFRDSNSNAGRAHSTAIYFLLKAGEASRWHRIDAAEIWHFYRGDPLELKIGGRVHILGPDLAKGEQPQIVVPAGEWQAARSLGDYTLVGCTVAPGFEFSGFEMAPEKFAP